MTEDEAKTKWCPQARVLSDVGSYNAEYVAGRVQPAASCIASACMAWRWTTKHSIDGAIGYCGLAGSPS
uniref:Uncharacterized protein n=1 Tax=viral metagenome TaxID=1070528 RepID=A0A6M3LSV1_9ZZZZ